MLRSLACLFRLSPFWAGDATVHRGIRGIQPPRCRAMPTDAAAPGSDLGKCGACSSRGRLLLAVLRRRRACAGHNRDMADGDELKVNAALLEALDFVPIEGDEPSLRLILAACIQQLAVEYGLVEREDARFSWVEHALPGEPLRLLTDMISGRR